MVKAAVVCRGSQHPISSRASREALLQLVEPTEEGDGEGGEEEKNEVVIRLEEVRLEQPISHDAVEVLHTFILCTHLDLFFCTPLQYVQYLPSSSYTNNSSSSSSLAADAPNSSSSHAHADPTLGSTVQQALDHHHPHHHHHDVYSCIPGFCAVGVITELGSGVLSHHIGQRVAYCTFPTDFEPSEYYTRNVNADTVSARFDHAGAAMPSYNAHGVHSTPFDDIVNSNVSETRSMDDIKHIGVINSDIVQLGATWRTCNVTDITAHEEKLVYGDHEYGFALEVSDMYRVGRLSGAAPMHETTNASDSNMLPFPRVSQYYCSVPPLWAPVGADCEARIVPVDHLIPLPDDIDDRTIATILFPGLIASALVHEGTKKWRQIYQSSHRRNIKPDIIPKVLVYPAMGVLGSLVCQLAGCVASAFVIGAIPKGSSTTVSEQECSRQIVFTDIDDLSSQIQSGFGGNASIIYDLSGKGPLQSCLDCLGRGGLYVSLERLLQTLHTEDHRNGTINEEELPGEKTLVRMHHVNYVRNEKDLVQSACEFIELYRREKLKCPVVDEYPLESALQAHKNVHSQVQVGGLGVCLIKPSVPDPRTIPDLS